MNEAISATTLYPSVSPATLKNQYIGKHVKDVQAPAAILDAAIVRRNCSLMLEAAERLNVGFRAHVKTHKTTEIARLQVDVDSKSVKLVCSTVSEIEHLLPWLQECRSQGKEISVLYGLPLTPSQIPRLGRIAALLGEGSVGVFVDHPSHITSLNHTDVKVWPGHIPIWVNIDVGYHREGITADSAQLSSIAKQLQASSRTFLAGLYSHTSLSYDSHTPEEALKYMIHELQDVKIGAEAFQRSAAQDIPSGNASSRITLSIGSSPSSTAIQNLLSNSSLATDYLEIMDKVKAGFDVEFHAGVYTVNDMQQIATRSRPQHFTDKTNRDLISYPDIGFRVLAEVASVYANDKTRGDKPEALVAAGNIALGGREVCKAYSGWGVVTPWPAKSGLHYDIEGARTGWIVGRISQEHGILTWEGPVDQLRELEVGEKLMIWPNHACIAGVNFGWYLVVNSDTEDADVIRDVWLRCRGW